MSFPQFMNVVEKRLNKKCCKALCNLNKNVYSDSCHDCSIYAAMCEENGRTRDYTKLFVVPSIATILECCYFEGLFLY